LLLALIGWFSFIKKYDHSIQFKVDLPAGSVYNFIIDSTLWKNKKQHIITKDVFNTIQQDLSLNGKQFELFWQFDPIAIDQTQVVLNFINKEDSFSERYKSLFHASSNLDSLVVLSKNLKNQAKLFSQRFKVEIVGIDTLPNLTYLYTNHHSVRTRKAKEMIANNTVLFSKNQDSLVQKTGHTFVKIDRWRLENDSISFRYAFPVKPQQSYPTDNLVMVDSFPKQTALKAIFYGNYSLSDQAWIAMHHFAKENGISITYAPVEIFYNNPLYGGDDRTWKAEIYMPITNHKPNNKK
jgi:effector-binding domain-containing protein